MEAGNFRMKVPSVVSAPISKSEVRVRMGDWSYIAKRRNTDTTQALKANSVDGQSMKIKTLPVIMRSPSALASTSASRRRSALACVSEDLR